MKKILNLVLFCLLVCSSQVFGVEGSHDYSALFQPKVGDRISAILRLKRAIKNDEVKVDSSLKEVVYRLIEEHEKGIYTFKPQEDPEELYLWNLDFLAMTVNDKRVRGYLIKAIGNPFIPKTLAKQGDDAVDDLLLNMNQAVSEREMKVRGIIETFILMIKNSTISNTTKQEINQQLIDLVNKVNQGEVYATSKNDEADLRWISSFINEPALEYMSLVKDKAFIPSIKLILENDQGASKLKYTGRDMKEMPKEKRHEYIMKLKEEHDHLQAAGKTEDKKYYPVREKAKEVLEIINGVAE